MIGIYKITNLINNKCYIGQSVNIERRWKEHCRKPNKSKISKAIFDFGKENFSFQILEECSTEELNKKEQFYIKKFNSIYPNGYNIEEKSNSNPSISFLKEEIIIEIKEELKDTKDTFSAIAKRHNVDVSTVSRINYGQTHFSEDENYPLRKDSIYTHNVCKECGKEISYSANLCKECYYLFLRRTTWPSREELKLLIRSKSFTEIGKIYGVSDNSIKKWCNKYNLPSLRKDIKNYSDKEWEDI